MSLGPPNKHERVPCAVAIVLGEVTYYGRGIESGDWYMAPSAPQNVVNRVLDEASTNGERVVYHPYGPAMVRLDWLRYGEEFPDGRDWIEELKRISLFQTCPHDGSAPQFDIGGPYAGRRPHH